jgi:hypothetical protein
MDPRIKIGVLPIMLLACHFSFAQQTSHYDLVQMLNSNELTTGAGLPPNPSANTTKQAISVKGIIWLNKVSFTEGTIDIDLRGKNVFLQSFLGIAFHGVDTSAYEVVFFRPFNFRHADTLRRKWSVQYSRYPDNLYDKLRREHPLVYENAVTPVPDAEDWFHATLVIKGDWITVYVNHSAQASLRVKKLGNSSTGKIALWDDPDGLSGDFADLTITQ